MLDELQARVSAATASTAGRHLRAPKSGGDRRPAPQQQYAHEHHHAERNQMNIHGQHLPINQQPLQQKEHHPSTMRRIKNYDNSQSTYYSGNAGNQMNQYGVGSGSYYNQNNGGYSASSNGNQYSNNMNNQYGYNNGMNNYGSGGSVGSSSSSSSKKKFSFGTLSFFAFLIGTLYFIRRRVKRKRQAAKEREESSRALSEVSDEDDAASRRSSRSRSSSKRSKKKSKHSSSESKSRSSKKSKKSKKSGKEQYLESTTEEGMIYEPPMYINHGAGGTPRNHPREERSRKSSRSKSSSKARSSRARSKSRSRSRSRGADAGRHHQSAVLIEMAMQERDAPGIRLV
jgi:cbb3-type cytochrome oxidase subunit 3